MIMRGCKLRVTVPFCVGEKGREGSWITKNLETEEWKIKACIMMTHETDSQ